MSERDPRNPDGRDEPVTNTAELRDSIPSGRTMGRSTAKEPSAAPFDTDDEAAGRPASREAIRTTLAHEAEAAPARRDERAGFGRYLPRIVVIAVLLAVAAYLFLR